MTSSEMVSKIDMRELSDGELENLAVYVFAEQERRARKREKQAVKDAMNVDGGERVPLVSTPFSEFVGKTE